MRKRVVRYLFCKTFDILIKERYNKKQAIDFYNRLQCGYGGTGRRAGLRSRCLRRGGSNPFIRTNKTGSTISAARFVLYRKHKGIWWGRKSTGVLLFAYGSWRTMKSLIANLKSPVDCFWWLSTSHNIVSIDNARPWWPQRSITSDRYQWALLCLYLIAKNTLSGRRAKRQIPLSAPNKNKTNLDGKSKFVLFFTRDYFGLKIKL